MEKLNIIGTNARNAAKVLSSCTTAQKNMALSAMAESLLDCTKEILTANKTDMQNAEKNGISKAMLDRLELTKSRIQDMADGIFQIALLTDPVGEVISGHKHPNGMQINKIRVPMGVVGIIYEARPNVTSDAAALCLKSGNACVLRGGSEALKSNIAVATALRKGLQNSNMPEDCVQLIMDSSRETATKMMKMDKYIDVLIPRGGAGLIKNVKANAAIPVIETGIGNCHIFVDQTADINMAKDIVVNAKTSRPSVCNAVETLLVHQNIAHDALPVIAKALIEKDVEIRGCEKTVNILKDFDIKKALPEDYQQEYNDMIIAVKVVDSLQSAIDHVNEYGTQHSEAIITDSQSAAMQFTSQVDAAAVFVNASTRFTDGGEFGMGAEIGISNQKLHTRGPMGLAELTTIKYTVFGSGQVR